MSSADQVTDLTHSQPLRRNAIGLPDVVFTSVTTMAPASAAAFSIAVGALFAGGPLVLGVVIALVGCMFTALSIGQMARHLPSAGGMYTYIARGLGSKLGFLAGWGFAGAYPLVVPLVSVLFGSILGIVLFVPAFFADLGIKLFSFISPLTYPLSLAGIVIGAWYALGVVMVIFFALRHPRRIADTAKVFMDDEDAAEALPA